MSGVKMWVCTGCWWLKQCNGTFSVFLSDHKILSTFGNSLSLRGVSAGASGPGNLKDGCCAAVVGTDMTHRVMRQAREPSYLIYLGVISDGGVAIKPLLRVLTILTFCSSYTSVCGSTCLYFDKEHTNPVKGICQIQISTPRDCYRSSELFRRLTVTDGSLPEAMRVSRGRLSHLMQNLEGFSTKHRKSVHCT
jgi:hypothetical protein